VLVWPPVPACAALQQLCSREELSDQRGQEASSPCLGQRYPAVCQKLPGTGESVELSNDSREAVLPLAESYSVLSQLSVDFLMSSFQPSVDLLMVLDGEAHARDDDYEDKCNQDKKQGQKLIRQRFNVEREAGRQYEERSRSNA
jgi:hypothetical protein